MILGASVHRGSRRTEKELENEADAPPLLCEVEARESGGGGGS